MVGRTDGRKDRQTKKTSKILKSFYFSQASAVQILHIQEVSKRDSFDVNFFLTEFIDPFAHPLNIQSQCPCFGLKLCVRGLVQVTWSPNICSREPLQSRSIWSLKSLITLVRSHYSLVASRVYATL